MVCKKSLYCWKNGPCASFQTRKKIWEDNIKFRESLKNVNRADHYWSFQISKNLCLCQDNEEIFCRKPYFSCYNNSINNAYENDCTSVAHDCNGLKYRNCLVHCPFQNYSKPIINEDNFKASELEVKKENSLISAPNQFQVLQKISSGKSELCGSSKNMLSNSTLKPAMKNKFASCTNLNDFEISTNNQKKFFNSSCEDIKRISNISDFSKSLKKKALPLNMQKKKSSNITTEVNKEKIKMKKTKEFTPAVEFIKQEKLFKSEAPLSHTTRKMLKGNKKAPFLCYGCNNKSNNIGAKKTHNVFASKLEVYPNALSAQQQKKNLILKYMQCEKEFQKNCFSENFKKEAVNHSSLWFRELTRKENKVTQPKNSKQFLPNLCRHKKKLCGTEPQENSNIFKINQKPKIYFY